MKLEIQRQDFMKAWQTAEKVVASKSMLDIMSCIRIDAQEDGQVILEATDLKTSVRYKAGGVTIIEKGEAVLPAAILGNMFRKLSSDTFTLEVNDKRGILDAGRSRMKFPVVPAAEFPHIPSSSGAESICEIPSGDLKRMINEGGSASSVPQDFPKYIGACLLRTTDNTLKIVSTDGKRLAVSERFCTVSRKNEDAMLPSASLKDLAKQLPDTENVSIFSDGPVVWFSISDVEFSIRKIEASFPEYERILSNEIYTKLNISCSELITVLERIDIVAKTTLSHIMVMDMKPEHQLNITSSSPEQGIARESLETEISGNPLQIGFNTGYFLEGLKALGTGDIEIEFSGYEGQTRMTRKDDSSFLYMLMPSRLSPQDFIDEELDDNSQTQDQDQNQDQEESHEEENHEEHQEENHEEHHEGEEIF